MPLTDVQKPAKVELRRDAAARAYREVLADLVDGALTVEMVADPVKGSLAVIKLAGAESGREDVADKIRERMKPFPVAYTVQWTR